MFDVFDYPLLVLVGTLVLFAASAWSGFAVRSLRAIKEEGRDEDFTFVLGGTLTLLGLLIGFTFSMAVGRYDLRKNLEDQEANAIGTESLRFDLLPASDAATARDLMRRYVDQRILFYTTRSPDQLREIDAETARLQGGLWSTIVKYGSAQPNGIGALVVKGMNDVIDAQGHTQAAYWNRIPRPAWWLLLAISIFCNVLVGYGARAKKASAFLVLPIALAITLFLIADIESPRGGMVLVHPQNLESVAGQLRPR